MLTEKKRGGALSAEEVIDRYGDMVYRLAFAQVKNRADADDIFQEVFIRLVRHLHRLKSEEHIKAWLLRVTVNCAKKHFTSYWHKNVIYYQTQEESSGIGGGGPLAQHTDLHGENQPEEDYIRREENPVTDAVQSLSEPYRSVVHLFYYEELSIAEIAAATGQKENTVKSHLFRARELLRGRLKGQLL